MMATEAMRSGYDDERDTNSTARGCSNGGKSLAGIWNGDVDIVVFVIDCTGGASDVDVIFEPFRK